MNIMIRTHLTFARTQSWRGLVLAGLALFTISTPLDAADRKPVPRVAARGTSTTGSSAVKDALKIAEECRIAMTKVKDYNATFTKRELIGKKMVSQSMRIKLRSKPFSVYLKFDKPYSGREVIYVAGRNNGKLVAHGTGFQKVLGTLKLRPTSRLVMRENRYPITEIGMAKMLEKTINRWEKLARNSRARFFPQAKLGNRPVRVVQTIHPKKTSGNEFHMTRLYIDKATNLPIRVQQFGFPRKKGGQPPLIEEYTYSNLRTNVGLKSRDFDVENPGYGF